MFLPLVSVEDMQEAASWMWTGKRGRGARLLTRTIQKYERICAQTWSFRDGWLHQNGWIFGKVPNSLWRPPHFRKIMLQFFQKALFKGPKCIMNFRIENDPPVLELFRKFILFSGASRPLVSNICNETSGPIIPPSFLSLWCVSVLFWSIAREKTFYLCIWSPGSSQQPFSCVWGYFWYGETQMTSQQPAWWSKSKPALYQWVGSILNAKIQNTKL